MAGRTHRHLAVVGLSIAPIWSGALGCSFVESFDGYSDRFDGGAAIDGGDDTAQLDATSETPAADTLASIDSSSIDSPIGDTTGVDTSCGAGEKYCGGKCIPVTADRDNCGDCGVSCDTTMGPLSTCSGGTCTCPSGTDTCPGKCTHLDRDPENCGSCGASVDGAHWCVGNAPTCRPGTTRCSEWDTAGTPSYHVTCLNSASCTDTSSDGSHCTTTTTSIMRCYGSPAASRCIGGACSTSACPAGHTACASTIAGSESCFDTQHDSNNCGACFHQCAPSEVCVDGGCAAYRPAKSCAECTGTLAKCCTGWSIPVCVATGSSCPATPGS